MRSGSQDKYKTMTTDEICGLPVRKIADENGVLFLWATVPMLPDALRVVGAWGYAYKTKITWRKTMSLGMGFWFRGQVEDLLLGVREGVKAFRCQRPNFIECKVLKHSEKPEEFRGLIEEATKGLEPRIELFVRRRVPGWDAWGDEVESDIEL